MTFPHAVAAALPAADRTDGDRLSWALDHQPDPVGGASTFSVPLSSDGSEPASHYGYNAQAASQAFVDTLQDAQGGTLPPIQWDDYDLTEARVHELIDAMEYEVTATTERPWPVLMDRLGLQVVRPEPE